MLDRQASAAGQIFAPAKSAFTPSLAFEPPSSLHGRIHGVLSGE
ncbi:hypothetical protein [Methylotuvimicrobium sp. KM2]